MLRFIIFVCLTVFPLLSVGTTAFADGPSANEIKLVGQVIKTSDLPEPSTAAYPDCLVFMKFKVLKVEKGRFDNTEALVAMWGFKNYIMSEPGRFKVGDKVKLTLVPYKSVERDLSQIMRVDDTQDYESELFWAVEWEVQQSQGNVSLENSQSVSSVKPNGTVEKVLRVLKAHGGEMIGSAGSTMVFGDYNYLIKDNFWESVSQENGRQISIIKAILEFNTFLKAKGIQLVTVFPPAAVAVYPEIATNVDYNFMRDGRIDTNFLKFKEILEQNSIFCVDLLPSLVQQRWVEWADGNSYPIYYQYDVHWTGFAAFSAGKAIADEVKGTEWFQKLFAEVPRKEVSLQPKFRLETREGSSYLKDKESWKISTTQNLRMHKVEPDPWGRDSSIAFIREKSNINAPVWILGDSFSLFGEYYMNISANLGLPYNLVASGSGSPTAVREELARIKDTSKIKVVIWEIAYPFLSSNKLWKDVKFAN